MAKTKKAGAADTALVAGREINIDRDAASSWDAFKLLRTLSSKDVDEMAKLEAAIEYAGLVSGLTEDEIADIAGGGRAQVSDVIKVVTEIIEAASPKN